MHSFSNTHNSTAFLFFFLYFFPFYGCQLAFPCPYCCSRNPESRSVESVISPAIQRRALQRFVISLWYTLLLFDPYRSFFGNFVENKPGAGHTPGTISRLAFSEIMGNLCSRTY